MKKWYDEEYEFEIEVIGFLRGDHTERYCRNGEEIGDKYTCTYGCPVNKEGYGICSKTMMILYPLMEAVRSGAVIANQQGKGSCGHTWNRNIASKTETAKNRFLRREKGKDEY